MAPVARASPPGDAGGSHLWSWGGQQSFDLYPLEPVVLGRRRPNHCSRSITQRFSRLHSAYDQANRTLEALNSLHGPVPVGSSGPTAARESVSQRVLQLCLQDRPPAGVEPPEAALNVLLGTKASFYDESQQGPAPYRRGEVSLPEAAGGCYLPDVLQGADREDIGRLKERLFLSQDELSARQSLEGRARAYWDPQLRSGSTLYLDFLKDLKRRGLVDFVMRAEEQVGVFFVAKKSGRLRMIVGCRRINQRMRRPPRTRLASSAAFCEVQIPGEAGLRYASHDVADCFYQFRIPKRLSRMLGMHPVRAGEIGISRVEGVPVSYDTMIAPVICVLPMGFSFALHWAQQAHLNVLHRSGSVRADSLLVDFAPPPDMARDTGHVVYVDNGVFACCVEGAPGAAQAACAAALEAAGLPVHEVTEESVELETLGLSLSSRSARVRPHRRWRLKRATEAFLGKRVVSGRQLEVLAGHFTYCFYC